LQSDLNQLFTELSKKPNDIRSVIQPVLLSLDFLEKMHEEHPGFGIYPVKQDEILDYYTCTLSPDDIESGNNDANINFTLIHSCQLQYITVSMVGIGSEWRTKGTEQVGNEYHSWNLVSSIRFHENTNVCSPTKFFAEITTSKQKTGYSFRTEEAFQSFRDLIIQFHPSSVRLVDVHSSDTTANLFDITEVDIETQRAEFVVEADRILRAANEATREQRQAQSSRPTDMTLPPLNDQGGEHDEFNLPLGAVRALQADGSMLSTAPTQQSKPIGALNVSAPLCSRSEDIRISGRGSQQQVDDMDTQEFHTMLDNNSMLEKEQNEIKEAVIELQSKQEIKQEPKASTASVSKKSNGGKQKEATKKEPSRSKKPTTTSSSKSIKEAPSSSSASKKQLPLRSTKLNKVDYKEDEDEDADDEDENPTKTVVPQLHKEHGAGTNVMETVDQVPPIRITSTEKKSTEIIKKKTSSLADAFAFEGDDEEANEKAPINNKVEINNTPALRSMLINRKQDSEVVTAPITKERRVPKIITIEKPKETKKATIPAEVPTKAHAKVPLPATVTVSAERAKEPMKQMEPVVPPKSSSSKRSKLETAPSISATNSKFSFFDDSNEQVEERQVGKKFRPSMGLSSFENQKSSFSGGYSAAPKYSSSFLDDDDLKSSFNQAPVNDETDLNDQLIQAVTDLVAAAGNVPKGSPIYELRQKVLATTPELMAKHRSEVEHELMKAKIESVKKFRAKLIKLVTKTANTITNETSGEAAEIAKAQKKLSMSMNRSSELIAEALSSHEKVLQRAKAAIYDIQTKLNEIEEEKQAFFAQTSKEVVERIEAKSASLLESLQGARTPPSAAGLKLNAPKAAPASEYSISRTASTSTAAFSSFAKKQTPRTAQPAADTGGKGSSKRSTPPGFDAYAKAQIDALRSLMA
jgi:hypothetical protein